LLLGAKDNFRVKSWSQSDIDILSWTTLPTPNIRICALTSPYGTIDPTLPVLYISNDFNHIARANFDLSWSMQWPEIAAIVQRPVQEICLTALCRLFLAAKDNFVTTPW
jgi:hypothetical protein